MLVPRRKIAPEGLCIFLGRSHEVSTGQPPKIGSGQEENNGMGRIYMYSPFINQLYDTSGPGDRTNLLYMLRPIGKLIL